MGVGRGEKLLTHREGTAVAFENESESIAFIHAFICSGWKVIRALCEIVSSSSLYGRAGVDSALVII